MAKPHIFFDSSALIAGIISEQGAARALLLLAENDSIQISVSEQVIAEVERNIARKAPKAIQITRELILLAKIQIVYDPAFEDVLAHSDWISHPADVPILLAAVQAKVDYLVTLNSKHFLDDPEVASRSSLRLGSPGDALTWVRNYFTTMQGYSSSE